LKYYQEILGDVGLKEAWPSVDEHEYVHVSGGLLTFAESNLGYSEYAIKAQRRFRALCKEHLPRKNQLMKGFIK
jgi:hypothetical protein